MTQSINPKECRFVVYVPASEPGAPDFHVVKEIEHLPDGTTKPALRFLQNFVRPFWVTKKAYRNHQQKKEWEDLDKLDLFKTTQANLADSVARAVGERPPRGGNMRQLCKNPYIYGSDINSTCIIKKQYQDKWPDLQTPWTVAVFDTETDVLHGTDEIVMGSITMKETVYTVVKKSFLQNIPAAMERVEEFMDKYLGEYVTERNLKCQLVIVDTEIEIVKLCFAKAHELKPDFLAIWNIDFDITKVINACEKAGVNPADIFSDPSVPARFKYFKYKQGSKKKVTASGKETPIPPAAQWHTVYAPASFYVIDAMCVYKQVRVGKPEEQSYSLDNILNKQLGIRKLKFKEADEYTGLRWHEVMQDKYPLQYIVYNRFDCISMEILDEKTKDLNLTAPLFAGFSDFENFKSQPRRVVDNLHYYCLSEGKVIASTSSEMADDEDDETTSLKGWIITLPAHLVADNGLCVIEEDPTLRSNIRVHNGDKQDQCIMM